MIPYTYPLTDYIFQFVDKIATFSREEKVCTGTITEAVEFIRLYVGSKEDKFPYTREYSVIQTLAQLEFIKILEEDQHRSTFLILDNTFRWTDYQKKPRIIKWFLRGYSGGKICRNASQLNRRIQEG